MTLSGQVFSIYFEWMEKWDIKSWVDQTAALLVCRTSWWDMNTEKEMVEYVVICFLTHQTRLWGWCSVQMSHWEWASEVRPSYIVEYVKVKKRNKWVKGGEEGAYSTGIHVILSSQTIPSLWSHPPKCVYAFMWERDSWLILIGKVSLLLLFQRA